ncbi:unnamed protein product [Colias eurytheme]|nr:unnamed protein product [Colias eurytheme]
MSRRKQAKPRSLKPDEEDWTEDGQHADQRKTKENLILKTENADEQEMGNENEDLQRVEDGQDEEMFEDLDELECPKKSEEIQDPEEPPGAGRRRYIDNFVEIHKATKIKSSFSALYFSDRDTRYAFLLRFNALFTTSSKGVLRRKLPSAPHRSRAGALRPCLRLSPRYL